MNGKTETTVTPNPPSQQELDYYSGQQALAQKQLDLLNQQQSFNQDYMTQTAPLLDAQTKLLQTQLDAANNPDPTQAAIQQQTAAAQLQQLQDNADLEPLQKQVLQAQLQQTLQGPNATPEQAAQIDAATKGQLDAGTSQINDFETTAMQNLRDNLAPGLGLRPSDTPITDRGDIVAKEAVTQQGQLASNLATANANAKLNYPLAAGQLSQAGANFSANLDQASQEFQASLADAAATNRARLLASTGSSIGQGINQGIGLISGARSNPLTFQSTGGTTTGTTSPGFVDILGAIGGAAKGGAALYSASDARVKYNVKTTGYDSKGRRWVDFTYKGEHPSVRHHGVIAQEVERTDPEAVLTNGIGLKFVDYGKLKQRAA